MSRRRCRAVIVAAALAALVAAPAAQAADRAGDLERQLRQRVEAPALGRDVTVHVRDTDSDEQLYGRDADEPQLPASTMKVVTAVTSLHTLGRGHRFATRVMAGRDEGTIILAGGGDPLLSAADLRRLAERTAAKLKKDGVNRVVVDVDDYLFPRPTDARGWEPGDSPTYAAAVRPLAMLGEYSRDTVSNALAVFVRELDSAGIDARVGDRAVVPDGSRRIAVVARNSLADAIELMLRVSENNVAEVLFRQVALARGYPATWSASTAAAKETLRELDLSTVDLKLFDGSGLSMDDRLTAEFLTSVFDRVVDPSYRDLAPIRRWVPIAGQTGTLTNRFSSAPASCARGEVFAKTGSLTGVNTLAGLTRAPDGTWRSFAVMVNHRPPDYAPALTSAAIDAIAATVHGCA